MISQNILLCTLSNARNTSKMWNVDVHLVQVGRHQDERVGRNTLKWLVVDRDGDLVVTLTLHDAVYYQPGYVAEQSHVAILLHRKYCHTKRSAYIGRPQRRTRTRYNAGYIHIFIYKSQYQKEIVFQFQFGHMSLVCIPEGHLKLIMSISSEGERCEK